jgi:cytochrome c-type biogenesis protein CcsB
MKMMALAMFIFLFAIGAATFFESVYGIQTAKLLIYNATWFEILLAYLTINLISNIFRYKLFDRKKIAMLTFHLSFIVIIIGAAITRFVSYEGLMIVPEGKSSNFIFSSNPVLWFRINDGVKETSDGVEMFQSEIWNNHFDFDVMSLPGHKTPISMSFVKFAANQIDTLIINDSIEGNALEIVTGGMSSNFVAENDFLMMGEIALSFDKKNAMPGILVTEEKGIVYIQSAFDMRFLPMSQMQEARKNGMEVSDSAYTVVPKNEKSVFQTATLYQVEEQQFVFKGLIKHAKKMLMPASKKDGGIDYLTVKITDGDQEKIVNLGGGMGKLPNHEVFSFNGLNYEMEYGATQIPIPFSIACRDFQLDRYPGSDSPSSFASELTIVDPANGVNEKRRVFMNNVMDYGGFRFFQSGYSPDETETHLSVNHDFWGTNITYLGYLLMAIGMILSLFAPAGRFREISDKLKGIRARKELLSILFLASFSAFGQDHVHEEGDTSHSHEQTTSKESFTRPVIKAEFMSEEHSDKLANMPVQDYKGRIIPMHTLCDELLRKLYRDNAFEGKNAVQVIVSMHMYPEFWSDEKVIYVPNNLVERLKLKGNYCSYTDLSDGQGGFKWAKEYNEAFQKPDKKKDEFDKKLVKTNEKFQILSQIFMWNYMKILPLKEDAAQTWYVPLSKELEEKAARSSYTALKYFSSIDSCAKVNDFTTADLLLEDLKALQKREGAKVIPSESTLNTEVRYNKLNIFKTVSRLYLLLGFSLLVVFFIKIFKNPKGNKANIYAKIATVTRWVLVPVTLYHASGLGMRWYITGHAPWSNGYEAVVFIALVTMLAGFIFSRKAIAVLAGTAILAFFMIFVTEMNLMDPEITPLQPVLKSYWLMIHVAIITGSYGFLGLGCILSILNLILYIFRNKENGKRFTLDINELTYIAEMTITVGLFMLTIGTFLGGIWANESWGRYWGWDPKETWALVSVLVYSIILHFRLIPAMSSKFTFNVASMWGYSAILFTFFGVNFYLVGLHSYAQGDGLGKIPNGLILTVLISLAFTIFAAWRNSQFQKAQIADKKTID